MNLSFDFNPPIETNTTDNVFVSELPKIARTKNWQLVEKVKIYPNPFSDRITFQWSTDRKNQIRIFDAQGQLISQHQVIGTQFHLNTASFANGMYYF